MGLVIIFLKSVRRGFRRLCWNGLRSVSTERSMTLVQLIENVELDVFLVLRGCSILSIGLADIQPVPTKLLVHLKTYLFALDHSRPQIYHHIPSNVKVHDCTEICDL